MGDFRKKILQTDFKGKHFSQENTWGKNSYTEEKKSFVMYNSGKKKILTPVYVREKNSITRGLGNKLLPKANHS